MFHPKKIVLFLMTGMALVALSACTLGQSSDQPTGTPVDVNAVKTSAAQTAAVELTNIAATAAVTPTFTATLSITDTPTLTQSVIETLAPGVTPSNTPLVIGGGDGATTTPIPSLTSSVGGGGTTGGGQACKNSQWGGDLTIPDGTVLKPGEKFTKGWTVRNTGTCRWDQGFYFASWFDNNTPSIGSKKGPYYINAPKDFVEPGGAVNIYIDMRAPDQPGDYIAHWSMFDDNNKQFGGDFTVVIKVVK